MERTEFSREATRLDREFQYLEKQINMCSYANMHKCYTFILHKYEVFAPFQEDKLHVSLYCTECYTVIAIKRNNCNIKNVNINLVILKIRSKRTQRNTEMPRGDMILVSTRMVSRIPPHTTKLSKRLKSDTKYAYGE